MMNIFDMKCTGKVALAAAAGLGLGLCALAAADDAATSSIGGSDTDPYLQDDLKKAEMMQTSAPGIEVNGAGRVDVFGPGGNPMAIQPANDLCANAIDVECGDKVVGSTANATFSDAGFCGTSHTAPETWYRLIGTGGEIEVTTCNNDVGFGYDTKLTVWTGTCDSLVCVGGNDDSSCPAHSGLLSRVIFNSVEGQVYYVMVHGFSSGVGPYGLNILCAEPDPDACVADLNEDGIVDHLDLLILASHWGKCPTAPGLPGSCVNFCGSQSPDGCWCDEACCNLGDCCEDKQDVCGGCFLPDPECPGDLNDDGVVNMLDVLILLDDWGCTTDVAANNTCGTAIALECNSKTTGSTADATFTDQGTCGTTHTTNDVWYTVIGTGGPIEVTTCNDDVGFGFDTKLTVWTGTCDNLVCVGGNDDAPCPAHSGLLSRVTFNSVEGQTYYIMVHGFSQNVGDFGLEVICMDPPEPLECPDGGIPENEPCGDDVNGGCNSDPPVYHFVNDGDIICGNVWADGGTRDTDWYRVTVGPSGTVSATLTAVAPQVAFIVTVANFGPPCSGIAVAGTIGHSQNGIPGTASASGLTPGTDVIVFTATGTQAGGGIFEGFPCGAGPGDNGDWEYIYEISAP
jgi:hypothetical protein